jgi:hypothetical protein
MISGYKTFCDKCRKLIEDEIDSNFVRSGCLIVEITRKGNRRHYCSERCVEFDSNRSAYFKRYSKKEF